MKKLTSFAILTLALCSLSITAIANESGLTHEDVLIGAGTAATDILVTDDTSIIEYEGIMVADAVYDLDLDGDGQTEEIYYSTYTKETQEPYTSSACLEIYKNGQLYWSHTDPDWSYYWDLGKFTLDDGKTYLLAHSRSDNDWNSMSLVLTQLPENDTLSVLVDLTDISRQNEELSGNPLSNWSRTGYSSLLTASGNVVTVPWSDHTKATGNMTVFMDYEISEDAVSLISDTLRLDEERTWTAWYEFDVYKEAGSSEILFHVSADDVVSLTEMTTIDGQTYLKCVNAEGEEGWFPDAAEYVQKEAPESPEGFYQGYFKECIFAG